MILDKLKAYGLLAALAAVTALLGVQTWRLHSAQLDAATTRTQHADTLRNIADLTAKAVQAVRAQETLWAKAQEKNANETAIQLTAARADAAGARNAADRLRQRVAALVAAARAAPAHSGPGPAVAPADTAIDLLADMQRRIDSAAGELAEYADAARIAGGSCEAQYDSLIVR